MTDKLIRALRLAVDACENPNHRTHHTLQQQCRFLDGLRAALLPALEEAEKQQAEGVAFGFGDRSTIVSQEAYSIFLEREKAARAELMREAKALAGREAFPCWSCREDRKSVV